MPWYKTGTVNVTLNSNAVTGVGTAFIANCRVGDAFRGPDGRWYEVTNAPSNTSLSISPAYLGPTASGGSYALAPMQGYVKDSADALRAIVNAYGAQLAALGTTGNYDVLPVTKGGTGGVTPAAARTGLGLKSAAVADVVGTVSQSGGLPIGAIIEKGINSNGEYTRFADGTQICRISMPLTSYDITTVSGPLYQSANLSVVWPMPFSATPAVSSFVGRPSTDSICLGIVLRSVSAADCYYKWWSTFTSSSLGTFGSFIAIGRWF